MEADKFLKTLQGYGADTQGAMGRFMDDAEMYESCVRMYMEDDCFEALGQALKERRYQQAFDAAHTLKGVAANLGLTPLLKAIGEIVEPLRVGNYAGLAPKHREICRQLDALKKLMDG